MTLGHIVSSTHIRPPKLGRRDEFDPDKVIEKSGVGIIKELIRNVQVRSVSLIEYILGVIQ